MLMIDGENGSKKHYRYGLWVYPSGFKEGLGLFNRNDG
jgi:hypothetical protein